MTTLLSNTIRCKKLATVILRRKCNTTLLLPKVRKHEYILAILLLYIRVTFFRPKIIVVDFLHLIVLICKVSINHLIFSFSKYLVTTKRDPTSGRVALPSKLVHSKTGSIFGRICRPSRSVFSAVFSKTRINTSLNTLERFPPPHGGYSPSRPRSHPSQLALSLNPTLIPANKWFILKSTKDDEK